MSRKPNLTFNGASSLLAEMYTFKEVKNFKEFVSYDDQNLYFEASQGEFVLKITNGEDSKDARPIEVYFLLIVRSHAKSI